MSVGLANKYASILVPNLLGNYHEIGISLNSRGHEEMPKQVVMEWWQVCSFAGRGNCIPSRVNRNNTIVTVGLFVQTSLYPPK